MACEMTNNKFLINAPAGSGKTTSIRNKLKSINIEHPEFKVLCITYTNRAAEELKEDLDNLNITVSTIHSYINDLVSPFFAEKGVIDLYWSIFGQRIERRILNADKDENVNESNQHYIEKYGSISLVNVRSNLIKISYGETPFTSLYTGKLSHDDLLMFAFMLTNKYPVIFKKIYEKYNYIFIDEYQDTSAYVLKMFYAAVKDQSGVFLYLLGDRMQQIYPNYDGSFEEEFKIFDTSSRLEINHRSINEIIFILNNIYNDSKYDQKPSEKNKDQIPDVAPKIIISSNPDDTVSEIQKVFPQILTLYLMNREKYNEIGAINLYNCFTDMESYSFGKKYKPTDVLSDLSEDNPDPLMKCLFSIYNIMQLYSTSNYGTIISLCKMKSKYFNTSVFRLQHHADKAVLKAKLEQSASVYGDDNSTIGEVLAELQKAELLKSDFNIKLHENEEYSTVFDVGIKEVRNLAAYLNTPTISTQHGVKGESHPSVAFVANDSFSNPNVRMYSFFSLWSSNNFSLTEFENFYYNYIKTISEVEKQIGMKTSDLTADTHNKNDANKEILKKYSEQVLEKYKESTIFQATCKSKFEAYLSKPIVGNAKEIFKATNIEGILTAYKLFYVGCSRARKNLLVVVDKAKICNFQDAFIKKVKAIGFEIEICDKVLLSVTESDA